MKEFPPFRLDAVNQCLWRRCTPNDERIQLTPKAFAVLRYLVDHAGRLVTQRELLDALWPGTAVQPEVLKSQILDIRSALGDSARTPRFIETMPRRGYRFIAAVTDGNSTTPVPYAARGPARLVGRSRHLGELRACLEEAAQAKRRVLFLTGESGIGKTALVDEFARQIAASNPSVRLARGQCLEGYGGKEAYYPMLEALSPLCRAGGGESVVQILADQAPTWLVQFPSLLKREHRQTLRREILGATRERMLREIGEAIAAMTVSGPLVLIFEDLQWVDASTVDLISALARGRRPAKLMLLATYRLTDPALSDHPFQAVKQDLLVHQLCKEIVLEPLGEAEIAEYLAGESSVSGVPEGLATLVHRRSEGNPLFMVAALDHMSERGLIARKNGGWQLRAGLDEIEQDVPESLRQMIEAQIASLTVKALKALEAASVHGAMFSSCISAAAAGFTPDSFEKQCEELSRRDHLVRWADAQRLPDGSLCQRFEFVHALYRDVCYRRQPAGRRAKLHLRIGLRLEELFPDRLNDIALELAHHFEAASDLARAVRYLHMAAERARHRFAQREAAAILARALELNRMRETDRFLAELEILEKLAATYVALFDPRAVETYEALAARATEVGRIDVAVRALIDVAFPLASIDSLRYLEVLDRALQLSAQQGDPVLQVKTRATCLVRRMAVAGWNPQHAEECRASLEWILQTGDRSTLAPHLIDYSFLQSLSSQYREAYGSACESFAILKAEGEESPYLSVAYWLTHRSLLFLGEWGEALCAIDAAIATVEKNGDYYRGQTLRLYRAWVQFNALDFNGVLAACESLLPAISSIRSPSGMRLWQVLAGSAHTLLGHHEQGLQHLLAASDGMNRQVAVFDWYWRLPIELGLTELHLARGDLAQARPQAERFLESALETAERTWQALAWEANARVAAADGDHTQARICIGNALTTMEGNEVPLAAWRVHATAAELEDRRGEAALAEEHRALSRATIHKLANSLAGDSTLREIFLGAPLVSGILRNA